MATFQPINPLDFIKELFLRLGKKNPKFFQILSWILTICSVIAGVPLLLTAFGVTLPPAIAVLASKSVFYATALGVFLSNLPVADVKEITKTDPEELPLTVKAENNAEVKKLN